MCAIVINSIYAAICNDLTFFRTCLFFLFNVMVVLTFRQLGTSRQFLSQIVWVLRAALVLQLLLYLLSVGRWYDGYRYMGTFNDPNQYGFYVLIAYLIIQLISHRISMRVTIFDDLLALVLLITSSSTGMVISYLVFVALKYIVAPIKQASIKGAIKSISIIGLIIALALPISVISDSYGAIGGSLSSVGNRITAKVAKMNNLSLEGDYSNSIILDRNLDKIGLYPEYLVFGAGDGKYDRFVGSRNNSEVHSTWFGSLFCYGVIPFAFLIAWIAVNLKRAKGDVQLFAYLTIILEAFTLANQRQPLFWLAFMIASLELTDDPCGAIDGSE